MATEETQQKAATTLEPQAVAQIQPANAVSPRKSEANRENAQRSTGPKTPEGKAKSSQNAIKHGIFVKQLLQGASPEAVAELETLLTEMQDYYQPVGKPEELLVEKIVVENARYARILGFEQQELLRDNAFFNPAVDRVGRYTTSTNRALCRAIEDLERLQATRRARESARAAGPEQAVSNAGADQ